MDFPKKEIKKWIDALNSGEYKQGRLRLYNPTDHSFCCLGVACRLQGVNNKVLTWKFLPRDIQELPLWLKNIDGDFSKKLGSTLDTLAYLNDVKSYTFYDIANLLQLIYIEEAL